MMAQQTNRPQPAAHDESPSVISTHAFEPKGAWWSLCKHCNLAESAHKDTTRFWYVSDDEPEEIE